MIPVQLFTAFHGNLDFSAMPESDRALVISRCYWPLLDLPERLSIPIGFEMSARTLKMIGQEDPEWLKRFIHLAETGRAEVIGSGWAQIVAPLAPIEVNRANLALGRETYLEILGFEPQTYFANEQTVSEGTLALFQEVGARRVIIEWNNPAARRPELRSLRGQPARWAGAGGDGPILLWNDSIVFQKAQRVAHGVIPETELTRYLDRILQKENIEALCIYGGDVEIFDYRPSRAVPLAAEGAREIDRLLGLFEGLNRDPRFGFSLPRDVGGGNGVLPEVLIGSAADPIPCKKQPRYNPTRWAVSGRGGFAMNTRCHGLLQSERMVAALGRSQKTAPESKVASKRLVDLWRSDLRTRATEEKIEAFESGLGTARAASRAALANCIPSQACHDEVVLANPWELPWRGSAVSVALHLPVGRCEGLRLDFSGEEACPWQIDVLSRHRDGSLRDARLVFEPQLDPETEWRGKLIPCSAAPLGPSVKETTRVQTESVRADFLAHRGAALESLTFPGISNSPLLGTIGHGTFDTIELTPDFYSGHIVAVSETGAKTTDLERAFLRPLPEESGAVRTAYEVELKTALGPWKKTIRIYRNRPRIEWLHDLRFHEARLSSLRLGILTFMPWAWEMESLRYGTVNGGEKPDWYALGAETVVAQSAAVSSSVSATSCLGGTEGWVALEDCNQGVLIEGDRSLSATAPMLDYRRADDAFFCRLSHSAAESDETRASFIRGQRLFSFAAEAYETHQEAIFQEARLRHRGLAYRTEKSFGITGNL